MSDIVRVKKKDVRRILYLYTVEGLTQNEVGSIVFGDQDIMGLSPNTLVQRVLHYLGVNMEHRNDYQHEGLTQDIIDLILDNRYLAFPLSISVNEAPNPAIIFDEELKTKLGTGKNSKFTAKFKNTVVIALLVVLTYFAMKDGNETSTMILEIIIVLLPIGILTIIEGYKSKGLENHYNKSN